MNVIDIARRDPRWSARRAKWSIQRLSADGTRLLTVFDETPAGLHPWEVRDYRDGHLLANGEDTPAEALRAVNSHDAIFSGEDAA